VSPAASLFRVGTLSAFAALVGCATLGTGDPTDTTSDPPSSTTPFRTADCGPYLTRATAILAYPKDSVSSVPAQHAAYADAMHSYSLCLVNSLPPAVTPTERCAPILQRATTILMTPVDSTRTVAQQVSYATYMSQYHNCLSSSDQMPPTFPPE
jgi:hypothetical protein